jgi:hypothetical protein
VLDRMSLSNNFPASAVEVRPDRLDASGETVWTPWVDAENRPLVRIVNGLLYVGQQTTLRLAPDTVVKFSEGAGLDVSGNLIAEQAVLTSLFDDQHGGQAAGSASGEKRWQGVILRGRGLMQLQDCLIRYAEIGVSMFDAAPRLSRVRIQDSWEAALGSDLLSSPNLIEIEISNNVINGLLIMADQVPEGVTRWDVIGSADAQLVRVIRSPFTVGPNSHLIIAPGVIVKFTQQAGLIIEGRLEIGALREERVILTALSDDTYGGNTDNLFASVFRGAWSGVKLNPNNTLVEVTLNNVLILYAMTGIEMLNPVSFEVNELGLLESQLYGMLCSVPLQFVLGDVVIDFSNNGQDISGCIDETLVQPADIRP